MGYTGHLYIGSGNLGAILNSPYHTKLYDEKFSPLLPETIMMK